MANEEYKISQLPSADSIGEDDLLELSVADGTSYDSKKVTMQQLSEFIGGGGSSTLSGLEDVSVTDVANGQGLKYDGTTEKWVNANPDVIVIPCTMSSNHERITLPIQQKELQELYENNKNKQIYLYCVIDSSKPGVLIPRGCSSIGIHDSVLNFILIEYESANSFVCRQFTISPTSTSTQVVMQSKFTAYAIPDAGTSGRMLISANGRWKSVAASISSMSNVEITDPQDGQVLAYDSASGKWVNKAVKGEVEKVISRSTFSVEVG